MKRFVIIALLVARIAIAKESQSVVAPGEFIENRGYVGFSVFYGQDQDFRKIAAVFANTPAAKAGMIAGDFILAIDQYSTAEMSLDEFLRHTLLRAGTSTQFTLKRAQTSATETVLLQGVDPATLYPKIDNLASYVPPLAQK